MPFDLQVQRLIGGPFGVSLDHVDLVDQFPANVALNVCFHDIGLNPVLHYPSHDSLRYSLLHLLFCNGLSFVVISDIQVGSEPRLLRWQRTPVRLHAFKHIHLEGILAFLAALLVQEMSQLLVFATLLVNIDLLVDVMHLLELQALEAIHRLALPLLVLGKLSVRAADDTIGLDVLLRHLIAGGRFAEPRLVLGIPVEFLPRLADLAVLLGAFQGLAHDLIRDNRLGLLLSQRPTDHSGGRGIDRFRVWLLRFSVQDRRYARQNVIYLSDLLHMTMLAHRLVPVVRLLQWRDILDSHRNFRSYVVAAMRKVSVDAGVLPLVLDQLMQVKTLGHLRVKMLRAGRRILLGVLQTRLIIILVLHDELRFTGGQVIMIRWSGHVLYNII